MARASAERASGWLVRRRARERLPALVLLVVVVALSVGAALTALAAGLRTHGAYGHHLREAAVGDLVVNPSLPDRDAAELIRSLPGVRRATHDAMFLAGLDDGHPRTRAEFEGDPHPVLVRGSTDGRRIDMDRPAISRGREVRARDEVLVTGDLADRLHLDPGDPLQISFWNSSEDVTAELDDVVAPIAVEDVTVAGVATLHDEVLPDDLYPRGQVIVSPEMAAAYDCLGDLPPVDAPLEAVVAQLLPDGCATSYHYWSLDLRGGAAAVPRAVDELARRFERLDAERLPKAMLEQDFVHAVIATTTADEARRVERSTQPTTTALLVLAAGTGLLAAVVTALAIARELRVAEDDVAVWRQMGMAGGDRARALAVPLSVAVAVGTAGAVVVAWALSPLAPVGSVRSVDPHPARHLPWTALAAGGAGAIALLGLVLALSRAASRRPEPRRSDAIVGPRRAGAALSRTSRPAVAEGLRAALGPNRGARLVAAAGAVAVGTLVAAVVFGATLRTVVDTPADYGWRWDAGVLGGFGYGRQDIDTIRATLDRREDVEHWDGLAMAAFTVDREPVIGLVGLADRGPLRLTMASGRMPRARGEVALGSRTAAAVGARVGDEVELAGDLVEPHRAKVTGIAVLPALGPFQSDRTAPGVGVVAAPDDVGRDLVEEGITFVGLDLASGVDPSEVLADLREDLDDWAVEGDYTFVQPEPVRPPEIVDARGMRAVPLLVGGLLAAAAAVCLVSSVAVSVRSRRRHLGTLRAIGFTGFQVRGAVRVQTLATVALALAVGLPAGVVTGRLAWRAFATRLGVVTDPSMPWGWMAATVAGGVVVALAASAVPARAAARIRVADAVRGD